VPSVAAVIAGHMAQRREPLGRAFSQAGLITGYLGLGITTLVVLLMIVLVIRATFLDMR
jgi:hypothetical protein